MQVYDNSAPLSSQGLTIPHACPISRFSYASPWSRAQFVIAKAFHPTASVEYN
ncbi:hypothetical protein [Coleofasciculus sp. H7-2]|uniref:hypothetical protein n=1 Tax=Coleofasciculus sp. H7-2 TaxID=3351545 RepID=UPI00366E77F1